MNFIPLVTIEVLFIAGIGLAQYDEKLLEVVKLIMCDPDPAFEILRNVAENCTTDEDFASDVEFYKLCGLELSSSDMEGVRNYYCITSTEDIQRDNECLYKKIKEMGKEEEWMKRKEKAEVCVKTALGARRKK